jgi:DNA integrity scanning protein DisA with diadenylate cyclase activity
LFNLISISLFAFILELNSINYGFNFLAFIILWFVVRYAIKSISQKNVLSFVFFAFIGCLTYQLLFYIYSLFNHSINRYFNWQSLIYDFIVLVIIYFVYDFAKKKIQS